MSSIAATPDLLQELRDHNEAPLILGPIAGFTDAPMRRMVKRFSPRVHMYVPFISSRAAHHGDERTGRQVEEIGSSDGRTIHAQIFGDDPVLTAETARRLESEGAATIDLNMGCPVNKVAGKGGAGAFFLREPEQARRMIRTVVHAVRRPVSIKTRLGWSDPDSEEGLILCRIAEEEGCSFVTVHGRARSQMYGGDCSLRGIARIVDNLGIPVIGNGDVTNARTMMRMVGSTGCAGVMIARAAIGAPWIFEQILCEVSGGKFDWPDRRNLVREHFEASVGYYGIPRGVREFRKHLVRYLRGIPSAASLRNRLVRMDDADEIGRALSGLEFTQ